MPPPGLQRAQIRIIDLIREILPFVGTYNGMLARINSIQKVRTFSDHEVKKAIWYWKKHAHLIGDRICYSGGKPGQGRYIIVDPDWEGPPHTLQQKTHVRNGVVRMLRSAETSLKQLAEQFFDVANYEDRVLIQQWIHNCGQDMASISRTVRRIHDDVVNNM